MNYDVERLKETQCEILDYIVNVCEENQIPYYIYFGTLLGAVRHRGYIPWDDDLDIALRREDYEKLVKILTENQTDEPRFFVQSLETDPKSPVLHTKIRRNDTECLEKNTVSEEQHKGIFIDIFPLDYYENSLKYNLTAFLVRLLYSLRGILLYGKKQGGAKKLISTLLFFVSVERLNRILKKSASSLNKKSTDDYSCYICRYKTKNCSVKKEWLDKTQKISFEDRFYCAPYKANEVLTKLYGSDYNELPPENKRITHEYRSVKWFYN